MQRVDPAGVQEEAVAAVRRWRLAGAGRVGFEPVGMPGTDCWWGPSAADSPGEVQRRWAPDPFRQTGFAPVDEKSIMLEDDDVCMDDDGQILSTSHRRLSP